MDNLEKLLFKGNIKYDEASILLFFISLEISNLLQQIRDKSPEASKIVPKDASILTPEQIEEARNNETNFVKQAIAVAIQRQEALNKIVNWLDQIDKLSKQIQTAAATIVKEKTNSEAEQIQQLEANLLKLSEQKKQLNALKIPLEKSAAKINKLLTQHAKDWQQHYAKFTEELIQEFAKHNLQLSDLEKQEIRSPTKSIKEMMTILQQFVKAKKD
jgi:hypothetical protein